MSLSAGAHHLRATPRYKLFQPTDMSTDGVRRRVHLLNVSAGGALIFAANPPMPGATLQLECGVHSLPARVAWSDERRFGVSFMTPLADADVRELIAAQDALVSAASRRIGARPD